MVSLVDWLRFHLGELKRRLFGMHLPKPKGEGTYDGEEYRNPFLGKNEDARKLKKVIPANCERCGNKLRGVKSFECNYCSHYYCNKHYLPEKHACKGNPKAPAGGYRVRYTADGKTEVNPQD